MDAPSIPSQRGHGRYEHWLWPLYYSENYDAGCQQCHAADMVTEHATVLNEGKQLYRQRGCIGCHRFQGFDNQDEQLVTARQQIMQLAKAKADDELEIPRLQKLGDNAPDNAAAERYYAQATNLTVDISRMDAQPPIARTTQPRPTARNQESRPGSERSAAEIAQGMDSVLDRPHHRISAHDKNAAIPLVAG